MDLLQKEKFTTETGGKQNRYVTRVQVFKIKASKRWLNAQRRWFLPLKGVSKPVMAAFWFHFDTSFGRSTGDTLTSFVTANGAPTANRRTRKLAHRVILI